MTAGTVVAVAHDTSEREIYTWTRFPLSEEEQASFNASNWERVTEKVPVSAKDKEDFESRDWYELVNDRCEDCDRQRAVLRGMDPETGHDLHLCLPCVLERSRGFKLVVTWKQNRDFLAIHNGIRLKIVDGRIKEIEEVKGGRGGQS
jgi:hypothetical protein